jgi:hypothetical protein
VLADVSYRHLVRTILEPVFGCEVVVTRPPSGGKRPAEIAFDGRRVWAPDHGDTTLSAIDPDHDNQVATYQVGFHPSAITSTTIEGASGRP